MVLFMAPECAGGPGPHIGKIPGSVPDPTGGSQGRIRVVPDTHLPARGAMMGNVEDPARWDSGPDPFEPWHRGYGPGGHWHRRGARVGGAASRPPGARGGGGAGG